MKKIEIKIPDNLTPQEEIWAIAKKLNKKMLSQGPTTLLGSGYEIKDIQTQITITREATEKPIKTIACTVCKTIFEDKLGSPVYTNYGGNVKKLLYCSKECCQAVIDVLGEGRVSLTRGKLQAARTF